MMPAASMPMDLRGPAMPQPPAPMETTATAFAGILTQSRVAVDAAAVDASAAPAPSTSTPQAILLPVAPAAAIEAIQHAGNLVAARTPQNAVAPEAAPTPLMASAPVAATSPAASPARAAGLPAVAVAARAPASEPVTPAVPTDTADAAPDTGAETGNTATPVDQIDPVPAQLADAVNRAGPDPVVNTHMVAAAADPATPTGTVAVHTAFPAQGAGAVQGPKNAAPRDRSVAAPGTVPDAATAGPLPQLLPSASWPTSTDGPGAAPVGGTAELLSFAGTALTAASPAAAAAPALSVAVADGPPLPQLDLGNDNHWIASLAQDIAALQADDGLLQFQLLPRHLGRIEVSVQSGSEGISVRVAAENAAAQSILATAQMRLVDDLRSNGVRLAATDIGMQAEGWAQDRRDQDRPHADQRWNFVETGHPADPLPVRARRARTDRLA